LLYYFYKNKFITTELLNLFHRKDNERLIDIRFELFECIYYNKHDYLDNLYVTNNKNSILSIIISKYCRDLKILKYCSDIFHKYNIKLCFDGSYKVYPNFPKSILKQYSKDFYENNKYYLYSDDENTEITLNLLFTDCQLKYFNTDPNGPCNILLSRYEINRQCKTSIKKINNDSNINNNENESEDEYNICTKDYLIKIYDPENCILCNNYSDIDYESFKEKKLNELPFVKKYLNNDKELNNILKNPKYIDNLNLKTSINEEYILIKFTYIISLIHNGFSEFIIRMLLSLYSAYSIELRDGKLSIFSFDDDVDKIGKLPFIDIFILLKNTPNEVFNSYVKIF